MNKNFFDKPNLLNSYWAGFIAADGCIIESRNQLTIKLSVKDYDHLCRFCYDIEYMTRPRQYQAMSFNKLVRYTEINIANVPKLIDDLKNNFNIIPRKTFLLKPPSLLDNNLILSYIIGYIDGDGWIYRGQSFDKRSNKKYNQLNLGVCGIYNMMKWIKSNIDPLCNANNNIVQCNGSEKTWKYVICGKKAQILIDKFKMINVPKLNRKWN